MGPLRIISVNSQSRAEKLHSEPRLHQLLHKLTTYKLIDMFILNLYLALFVGLEAALCLLLAQCHTLSQGMGQAPARTYAASYMATDTPTPSSIITPTTGCIDAAHSIAGGPVAVRGRG